VNTSMFNNTRLGHWRLLHRCYLDVLGLNFSTHSSQNISTIKYLPLAARYNWCQGLVPGRGPAVEKHWSTILSSSSAFIHCNRRRCFQQSLQRKIPAARKKCSTSVPAQFRGEVASLAKEINQSGTYGPNLVCSTYFPNYVIHYFEHHKSCSTSYTQTFYRQSRKIIRNIRQRHMSYTYLRLKYS
jgi:hypothetical protein